MSDIYLQGDTTTLLDNRFIVVIGDSIQRAVYKDLVLLLQKNQYLTNRQLRKKGEFTFEGDKLIEGGQMGEMTNGVKYREVRQYQTDFHLARFYFVTRCYNSYVESILSDLAKDPKPDVFLMNSCLWDISRYGPSSVEEYKKNLQKLFKRLKEVLPDTCLVMWNTTLPISKHAKGGFLIPEVEFMNSALRLDILEANFYVHKLAVSHGYNILDLHYYLRHQLQRRADDGVHWDMTAHRRVTNLILTHIAQAWAVATPENARSIILQDNLENKNTPMNKTKKNPVADIRIEFLNNSGLSMADNNIETANFAQNFYNDYTQQMDHINKYGGPIRRPDWDQHCSPLMQIGDQQCGGNLNWEPYRNQEFAPMMKGNRDRNVPYTAHNRHGDINRRRKRKGGNSVNDVTTCAT